MSDPTQQYNQFNKHYYSSDGYEGYEEWHEDIAKDNVITPLFALIGEEPRTFMDVGCGMGGTILTLRKKGYEAFGIEVSPFCLAESPAKQWMKFGEAFAMQYDDNSFDVVICCGVFGYFTKEQAEKSVAEFCRVSKEYVSLWVFDPEAPSWSQTENPDDARIEDTKSITNEDYVKLFESHGWELASKTSDFTEDSGVPEWHLLFKKKA